MALALRFEQLIRHGTPTTKPTPPASPTSAERG